MIKHEKNHHPLLSAVLLLVLLQVMQYVQGSAVDSAPVTVRQFLLATTTSTASCALLLQANSFAGRGPTKSVLLCNDSVTAGEDIHFNLNSNTVVTPASGTGGAFDATLKPGEKLNFDGKYSTLAFKSAVGTPTLRVMASY